MPATTQRTNSRSRASRGADDQEEKKKDKERDKEKKDRSSKLATLSSSRPVEEFLNSKLLSVPENDEDRALQVSNTEPISSVVSQMCHKRQSSCIVTLANGSKEFFDCMDFASYLLDALADDGGRSPKSGSSTAPSSANNSAAMSDPQDEWDATKRKLRRIAADPIRRALRGSRRSNNTFGKIEASKSLDKLLPLLKTQRQVAVYQGDEFSRLVTPADILDLCTFAATEESKIHLDSASLKETMAKCPSLVCKFDIPEDQTLFETLRLMRSANVYEAPVLASAQCEDNLEDPSNSAGDGGGHLVGQFEVDALRALFARNPDEDESGPWWWEDAAICSNILQETCRDFVALAPSIRANARVTAFSAVVTAESFARAISRAMASNFRSVIVYEGAKGTKPSMLMTKTPQGIATTLGLTLALLESGIMGHLVFDPGKQRRSKDTKKPTLTLADLQAAVSAASEQPPERTCKVSFAGFIELNNLVVPTCLEHAMDFMRYSREGDSDIMDFQALKDWVSEAKAVGAESQCIACHKRLGKIARNNRALSVPTKAPRGQSSDSESAARGAFGNLLGMAAPQRQEEGAVNIPAVAGIVKGSNGLNGLASPKVSRTKSGGSQASQASADFNAAGTTESAQGLFWFGFCCAGPCREPVIKDQIIAGENPKAGARAVSALAPVELKSQGSTSVSEREGQLSKRSKSGSKARSDAAKAS